MNGKLKTVKSSATFNREALACPICGFEYVHPIAVRVATGENLFVIESEDFRVLPAPQPETEKANSRRGVRIILEYACEAGHHGEIIFQFHKGNTFIEHEELPFQKDWATLWRT